MKWLCAIYRGHFYILVLQLYLECCILNNCPFPLSLSFQKPKIILHSMHKYQPRVHVIRKDYSSDLSPTKPVPTGDGVKTFSFPETVFTTVTAYQNQQVTKKIFLKPICHVTPMFWYSVLCRSTPCVCLLNSLNIYKSEVRWKCEWKRLIQAL